VSHPAVRKASYSEYLALEQRTGVRHEFVDGEAWAMAGGTKRHSAVKTNLAGEIYVALRGSPCRSYDSDLKLRVPATGLATYTDLTVICGGVEVHAEDVHAATNPTVVFEVLSPSTEAWDRGGKFEHLGRTTSLQQYVLLAQDRPLVEVFTRGEGGTWELRRYGAGEQADLGAIGVRLAVDPLYADLPDEDVV
jgi:Uma2 family endonuclease